MKIIRLTGENACTNYCTAYRDFAPTDLVQFSNLHGILGHSAALIIEAAESYKVAQADSAI